MHVVGPRGGTCGHHIYQIYASYLHVRILYEFLGTFQSLKVFGKFKNKSKCFWKPSSKFTIRNGYLVTVYKSGFEACLWSTSCASALVLALKSWHGCSACAGVDTLRVRRTVCSLKHPWSSPKNFRFRRCRRSNLDQNLPRITNPVSDLTGDQ